MTTQEIGERNGESREGDENILVLSRKRNEAILINDDIEIVVVEIRGDKVRLGILAPRETPVHRREVYDAIKRSQAEEAAKKSLDTEKTKE